MGKGKQAIRAVGNLARFSPFFSFDNKDHSLSLSHHGPEPPERRAPPGRSTGEQRLPVPEGEICPEKGRKEERRSHTLLRETVTRGRRFIFSALSNVLLEDSAHGSSLPPPWERTGEDWGSPPRASERNDEGREKFKSGEDNLHDIDFRIRPRGGAD